ncbi:MAG: EAL domain-containing protein [Dehalococcoidia bacterium]
MVFAHRAGVLRHSSAPHPAGHVVTASDIVDPAGAADRGELIVHYQPTFKLPGPAFVAFEALVRWQHPELGVISPVRFIASAEASGEIVRIGEVVLDTSVRQMGLWRPSGEASAAPQYISVNASAIELRHPSYVPRLRRILERYRQPPDRIQIEITESVLVDDADVMIERLHEMRDLGVRLAIDDFGTGYSSLRYLATMPLDVMKVDRAFVHGMLESQRGFAVMRATVGLARALGMQVIAEGVETERQEWLLGALGVDALQGFRYSRPLDVERATRTVGGDPTALDPVAPSAPDWGATAQ